LAEEESVESHTSQKAFHADLTGLHQESLSESSQLLSKSSIVDLKATAIMVLNWLPRSSSSQHLQSHLNWCRVETQSEAPSYVLESILRALASVCQIQFVLVDELILRRLCQDVRSLGHTSASFTQVLQALLAVVAGRPSIIWVGDTRAYTAKRIIDEIARFRECDGLYKRVIFGTCVKTGQSCDSLPVLDDNMMDNCRNPLESLAHRPNNSDATCDFLSRRHIIESRLCKGIATDALGTFQTAMQRLSGSLALKLCAEKHCQALNDESIAVLCQLLCDENVLLGMSSTWWPVLTDSNAVCHLELAPYTRHQTDEMGSSLPSTTACSAHVMLKVMCENCHRESRSPPDALYSLISWLEPVKEERQTGKARSCSCRLKICRDVPELGITRQHRQDGILAYPSATVVETPPSVESNIKWRSWVTEEGRRQMRARNAATMAAVMEENGLTASCSIASAPWLLAPDCRLILERRVVPEDQARHVILMAVKMGLVCSRRPSSTEMIGFESLFSGCTLRTGGSSVVPGGMLYDRSHGLAQQHRRASHREELLPYASGRNLRAAIVTVLGTSHVLPRESRGIDSQGGMPASTVHDKHERALLSHVIAPRDVAVGYAAIGGLEEVKEALRQAVTYPLKYPHLYHSGIAAENVKGVLLFGPPGTGKTMLAKAVATEGGASFLSIDASAIENKWLGESEKNARAVFSLARKLAPCVVFLDEIDSLLSSRDHGDDSSHGTLTSVKTTLMQEWDGLRTSLDRVLVIGSTNRPYDLDEAVLRRLPRRILVNLPDLETRRQILEVTLRSNKISSDVNLTDIAIKLEGYSGSDIKEVCREAVLRGAHHLAARLEFKQHALMDMEESTGLNSRGEAEREFDDDSPLRPVTREDFDVAAAKLSASVAQRGPELVRLLEWNERYGEVTQPSPSVSAQSLYL